MDEEQIDMYDKKSHRESSRRESHRDSHRDSHRESGRRESNRDSHRSHDSHRAKSSRREYDAPPHSPRDRAPEYHKVPPKYTEEGDENILYDDDESEKDGEYIDQRLEYYNQKSKQLYNEAKNLDESSLPDTKLIVRYRLKITSQKIKILKELLMKLKSNKRPLKASINRHLRFLVRKFDLLSSLENNLRDPVEIKAIQKKITNTKKLISHYNYLKSRDPADDTTEERRTSRRSSSNRRRDDIESSYSFSSDMEKVKRKSKYYDEDKSSYRSSRGGRYEESYVSESRTARPDGESVIELNNADRVPDEVVYHYYKPGKKGEWDHKVIKDVKPFEKKGKVYIKKHHEIKNHHHYLDDESTARPSRREKEIHRRRDYYDGPPRKNIYVDDEYVYYDGMKTVYNPHYFKYSHRRPYNIYIKNYY